jgi:hypothetical protein
MAGMGRKETFATTDSRDFGDSTFGQRGPRFEPLVRHHTLSV